MAERLTISSGENTFYENTYNKCSNKNAIEIKRKVEQGLPYYAINEYKFKQYSTSELSDIYSKLSKIEDIMEKYDIESVEELEDKLNEPEKIWNAKLKDLKQQVKRELNKELEADRDTWKRACALACEWFKQTGFIGNKTEVDYFYQQAKNKKEDR